MASPQVGPADRTPCTRPSPRDCPGRAGGADRRRQDRRCERRRRHGRQRQRPFVRFRPLDPRQRRRWNGWSNHRRLPGEDADGRCRTRRLGCSRGDRTVEVPRPQVEIPRPQLEEHTKADSVLGIRIDQSLSSATAKLEDRVTASVSRDLIVDGRTVLPKGTRLEGNVSLVQPGSKFKGRAPGHRFHIVLADGLRVPIQTETLYVTASRRRDRRRQGRHRYGGWSDSRWAHWREEGRDYRRGRRRRWRDAAMIATGDTKEVVLEAAHRSRCGSPDLSRSTIERDPLSR